MNDLISRQAAIKTAHFPVMDDASYEVVRVDDILALPSAQSGCEDAVYRKAVQMLLAYFVPEERYAEAVDGLRRLPSATDTNVGGNLIDRQAALDAIKKLEKPAPTAQHLSAIFDCEDTIKALPSAQPGWIQCTPETMPQEDGEYLVTIHWESGGYYTDLLAYKAYWKEWKDEDRIFGTVIAWQPKPKPWEGGQE